MFNIKVCNTSYYNLSFILYTHHYMYFVILLYYAILFYFTRVVLIRCTINEEMAAIRGHSCKRMVLINCSIIISTHT